MLRIFYHNETEIVKAEGGNCFGEVPFEKMVWIDLQFPTDAEIRKVEIISKINFNQLKSENKLESNSRFYESEELIFISSNFIVVHDNHFINEPVFLYLIGNTLITERNADLVSFAETTKKIKRNRKTFQNGSDVLEGILETKFDVDADFIEDMAKNIALAGKSLSLKKSEDLESLLLKISDYQEAASLTRESFIDKQRVVSALLKSNIFQNKIRLKILINDISTMLEFTSFIFIRLEYLQNTVLGLINIEQNKTIKIFTIVAVVFMPPTLIASIYGMNFKFMPELTWNFGYPFAIMLILGSSLLTLLVFKKKRWL